jgi:uncharacterized membrane protein
MSKGRLEAFTDGFFAIIITILVLEIKLPGTDEAIFPMILHLFPKFVAYFISFVIVGVYWVSHHLMMHYIKHTNRTFLWINLFFMMSVSITPFFAAILGEHSTSADAIALYSGLQVIIGLFSNVIWWYATKRGGLLDENVGRLIIRTMWARNLIAPVLYGIAIPVAYSNIVMAFAIFFVVPIVHIAPTLLDFQWVTKLVTKLAAGGQKA